MLNRIMYLYDKNVRINFIINLFDGSLFSFAMSLVSMVTVLPLLVHKIGGSNLAVGLIPVVWTLGFNIPQIIIANYASSLPFKKGLMLKTAFLQRVPWFLLALFSYFVIARIDASLGLLLFFFGFASAAVTGSMNLPGWFDLVAKITPVNLRGRLFAFRSIMGALMGIGGGVIVTSVLDSIEFPDNFALLFLLAFIVMMVSYSFLIHVREEQPNLPRNRVEGKIYIRRLLAIIREESHYRNFLVADALLISALMGDAFYTLNALQKFGLAEGSIGHFIIIMMMSMIIGNLVFGNIADRFGHKRNLFLAAISTTIISLTALFAQRIEIYYLVFIGSAFTVSLLQVSRLTIIAELCGEEDRPIYIALTNLITAPFILSGVFGGWLADRFGYDVVFIIACIFALTSAIWWWIKVPEPRRQKFELIASHVDGKSKYKIK